MTERKLPQAVELLTASEVAELTGIPLSTVYKHIARGRLDAVWERGKVRVHRASVDAYLAEKGTRAPAA